MYQENSKIFDSRIEKSERSFSDFISFKVFYYIAPVIVGSYIIIKKVTFHEFPLIYWILGVSVIYALVFYLTTFFSKKVFYLKFDDHSVTFRYKAGTSEKEARWMIESTKIELFQLKDYKSHFEGLQINFVNKTEDKKLKLLESDWSYEDFERIYLYFKDRKNEKVPENEKLPFTQLQLMTNSKK